MKVPLDVRIKVNKMTRIKRKGSSDIEISALSIFKSFKMSFLRSWIDALSVVLHFNAFNFS